MSRTLYNHTPHLGQCIEGISNGSRMFSWHQCYRKSLPGEDYCKQHLPANVEAARQARYARWESESQARQARLEAPGKRIVELQERVQFLEKTTLELDRELKTIREAYAILELQKKLVEDRWHTLMERRELQASRTPSSHHSDKDELI